MKRQPHRTVLITDAPRSQEEQLRSRQVRYVLMMAIRAACLIIGAILVETEVPLLWLWLSLCGLGMILLPWLAVMIANDRPPKQRHRLFNARRHREAPRTASLTAEATPHHTIDVES